MKRHSRKNCVMAIRQTFALSVSSSNNKEWGSTRGRTETAPPAKQLVPNWASNLTKAYKSLSDHEMEMQTTFHSDFQRPSWSADDWYAIAVQYWNLAPITKEGQQSKAHETTGIQQNIPVWPIRESTFCSSMPATWPTGTRNLVLRNTLQTANLSPTQRQRN